ncbi:hypothetical protein MgSA37_00957 [Mucilaginibacter gotjawali]|uniref:Uncharacterized protein n=2 Tax=Mucilaginibacter gotjawali TaxID=1550579 RepID=A0A839SGT8_9SPHI|nr:hypothetical protein [Mucilaginibacter gotjawali]BAU52794.1 hypothetical protein MgSA37_00957 [Mucilaginibacter gotjawali]
MFYVRAVTGKSRLKLAAQNVAKAFIFLFTFSVP